MEYENLILEHKFKQFLKDNDLMSQWKEYKKPKFPEIGPIQGWSENPERPIAEFKQILQKAVDNTRLVGGIGIVNIDFEVQHKEQIQTGTKITVEMKGLARANSKMQVRRMLENLMMSAKMPLTSQGFFLQIQFNTLHVEENKNEEFDFLVMSYIIHTNN